MIEQENKNKREKLQWHPAFCSATELELREDKENLEFESEHQLSSSPLKIDLMVIKKKPGIKLKNEIGHIFMTHNIIEYKSPDDQFNIDNYYKCLGYVCFYKSQGETIDSIPVDELTLSLFHDSKPVYLMKNLKKRGYKIIEKYEGIYYIEGDLAVPRQQIIVTEEFGNKHCFLKALSKKFTVEDSIELAKFSESIKSEGDRHNLDSVLQVSFVANNSIYYYLDRENIMRKSFDSFCEIYKDFIDEKIAAKVAAAEAVIREQDEEKIKALEKEIAELKKKLKN